MPAVHHTLFASLVRAAAFTPGLESDVQGKRCAGCAAEVTGVGERSDVQLDREMQRDAVMLQAHVTHSREVSALRAELTALEAAGEQRCQALQSQHRADMVERQLEGERQLARLRAEHETALRMASQGLRSELETQRLQAKAEMRSAVQELREAHAAELSRLRCELEQEQAQLLQVSLLCWTRQCQVTLSQATSSFAAVACAQQSYNSCACRASSIGQTGALHALPIEPHCIRAHGYSVQLHRARQPRI